jgi:hypothetical protein
MNCPKLKWTREVVDFRLDSDADFTVTKVTPV